MMNRSKSLQSIGILAVAISPALFGFSSLPSQSSTQSNPTEISLKFPPAGSRGAPKATAGGGTRSDDTSCISVKEGEIPLVALMPNRENTGKTATATPILYWYVPQTTAITGEFVLTDEDDNEVYQTTFALPVEPGIVKLNIPAKASLKPGKSYSWSFMIVCDSQYRNRDKYVEGVIQYTELSSELKSQLEKKAPLEKAKLYAGNKIWLETLNTVAQLRSKNSIEWEELLKSVGLEVIAQKPFVNCCTAEN